MSASISVEEKWLTITDVLAAFDRAVAQGMTSAAQLRSAVSGCCPTRMITIAQGTITINGNDGSGHPAVMVINL